MSGHKTKLIVAAIDFGTTYSGYAYSLRDDYLRDPLKVYTNSYWIGDGSIATLKAPTVVLFDPGGTFHSFGYTAENKYAQLAENGMHIGWKYFRRFKMELHDKTSLSRNWKLKDDQGNRMQAIDVFAASIKYMKDHLTNSLSNKVQGIRDTDIHWILTVPAIWQDSAKQFMQEAAGKAGIPSDQLELALEPEAAAIHCKEIIVARAKEQGKQPELRTFDVGAQFMIMDLGGGTVDITAHEVKANNTLEELCPPSGGPWGGTMVDKHIVKLLEQLFTEEVFHQFRREFKADYLDIQRSVELKKRTCTAVSNDNEDIKITLSVPSILKETKLKRTGQTIESSLVESQYANTIISKRDKLHFDQAIFRRCFDPSVTNILKHVRNLLEKPQLKNIKTIIMVGGFSESEIVSSAVKSAFGGTLTVLVPEQAETAVLKGAVMYGHNPTAIYARILPHTYGISTAVPFEEKIHPETKRVFRDGQWKCEEVFKVFMKAGTTVIPGVTKDQYSFASPFSGYHQVSIEVYRSENETPMFVSDKGCSQVGEIVIDLEKAPCGQKQMIDVIMLFGDTTLHVEARESDTNNVARAQFNFLK